MRTLCFTNAKGGVGKTTSAVNVAGALADGGARVLLVDLDQQASASISLGVEPVDADAYDVVTGGHTVTDAVVARPGEEGHASIDVVPASIRLARLDTEAGGGLTGRLARALDAVAGSYDYAVIDCPPSLGAATLAALRASDAVYIPLSADYLALRGINTVTSVVRRERERNSGLEVGGVIVTNYDSRKVLCRNVLEAAEGTFGKGRVWPVRTCVALAEAPSAQQTIFEYAPKSNGAADYAAIANAIAGR